MYKVHVTSKRTIYEEDYAAIKKDADGVSKSHFESFGVTLKGLSFKNCIIFSFPKADVLLKDKPNYYILEVLNCKLTRITSLDLKGFQQLTFLNLRNNDIEELPSDLFVHTPNLQDIYFNNNKIKVIGENILAPLRNLKFLDLRNNPGIDVLYYPGDRSSVSLDQFKEAIQRCKPVQEVWNIVREQKRQIDELKRENDEIKKICVDQNIRIDDNKKDLAEVKQTGAYQKFYFTIKVGGKEFKVQKELLIANSPLLAQMIRDNEDADTLELKDISEGTFEEILNFMHSKQPPKPTANTVELYAASGRLQMKELMDMCARMLIDNVTPENALEILSLCKKFPNIELQKKAHAEYGKTLNQ